MVCCDCVCANEYMFSFGETCPKDRWLYVYYARHNANNKRKHRHRSSFQYALAEIIQEIKKCLLLFFFTFGLTLLLLLSSSANALPKKPREKQTWQDGERVSSRYFCSCSHSLLLIFILAPCPTHSIAFLDHSKPEPQCIVLLFLATFATNTPSMPCD